MTEPSIEIDEETPPLTSPEHGIPPLIDSDQAALRLVPHLATDSGPVAVDTERASGFRYFQRAYLIQLKTASTGIHLIDPINLSVLTFSKLAGVLDDRQWILHAATQDLPSLREAGFSPNSLFDTELAARLLGRERVGLGPLLMDVLGVRLAKDHGRSDWSERPLSDAWLGYAALDVEFLLELRDVLARELDEAGKTEWARQEFAHTLAAQPQPATEQWRRTTDIHLVSTRRGLALVRELWTVRDEIAQELDLSPHRIINDRAISAVGSMTTDQGLPRARNQLTHGSWAGQVPGRYTERWISAALRTHALPDKDLPDMKPPSSIGTPNGWRKKNPEAYQRWQEVRPAVTELAASLNVPVENLISPKPLRALLWAPTGRDSASLAAQLTELGVRPWQREFVVPVIEMCLAKAR